MECGRCRLMLLPGIASVVQGGVLETCPSFPSITVKQIHSQIRVTWIWLKFDACAVRYNNIFRVIGVNIKDKKSGGEITQSSGGITGSGGEITGSGGGITESGGGITCRVQCSPVHI